MADKSKEWMEKFNHYAGTKAFFILVILSTLWAVVTVIIAAALNSYLVGVLLWIVGVVLAMSLLRSSTGWNFFRGLLNDRNLPVNPVTNHQLRVAKKGWWFYAFYAWELLLLLFLMFLAGNNFNLLGFHV